MFRNQIYLLLLLSIAYFAARRHKRWKANTLQFSLSSEKNLIRLAADLKDRAYLIKPSLCFIAFKPVKREIFAGDFRDRVIHHFIFNSLNPYYDRLFISDCYSCRQKRGTDYGIKRAAFFLRSASENYHREAYVLKLDISGYFMNIDRRLLYRKNKFLIKQFFKNKPDELNLLLYLLKLVIFNDPTKNCRQRGRREDWRGLPKNKSLFYAPRGKGLPIGNLTSQLFGNVYLNDFDHFVKEKLRVKYYGRYVDDMIFMDADKEYLKSLIPKINDYLKTNLGLGLHPKKIYLQPCRHGLKFLGAIIKPRRIYVGSRLKANFYQKIKAASRGQEKNPAFFNSYLGLMKKRQSFNLRQKIMTAPETEIALKQLKLRVADDYRRVFYDSRENSQPRLERLNERIKKQNL